MNIGLGIGIPFAKSQIWLSLFDPSKLFTSGVNGAWYDPSDINLTWRRNLLTYSEQFDNAVWDKTSFPVTVTADVIAAPKGTNTADLVVPTAASAAHAVRQTGLSVGTSTSFSVYAKSAGYDRVQLYLQNVGGFGHITFSLASGTVTNTVSGSVTVMGSITSAGNGWYLLSVAGTGATAVSTVGISPLDAGANGATLVPTYTGNGTSGIYIWGAQLEQGSTATAYQRITDGVRDYLQYQAQPVLYRDAAGTQPVTAVEQPVGLMLDKSKGLVLGSELVINGTFDTGITGWAEGVGVVNAISWDSVGKRLVVTNDFAYYAAATQTISGLTVGRSYLITGVVSNNTVTARLNITFGSSSNDVVAGGGTARLIFTATSTSHTIGLVNAQNTLGGVSYWDNISVRELPGNHAFNPSGNSANFPVLSARYNVLTKTELLTDAAWTKTAGVTVTDNAAIAPDGTMTASTIAFGALNREIAQSFSATATTTIPTFYVKGTAGQVLNFGTAGLNLSITLTGGWDIATSTLPAGITKFYIGNFAGNANALNISIWHPDLRVANDALNQPAYQRVNTATDYDTVGFKPYLKFNGTNQWLQTNSIDFSYIDKMFVCAGVRKLSDAAVIILETSINYNSNNGAVILFIDTKVNFGESGTGGNAVSSSVYSSPATQVLSALADRAGATGPTTFTRLGVNGVDDRASYAYLDNDAGNYGNYPLYIGARAGSSLWFNGRLYGMVVAGKQASAAEIQDTEKYMNLKTAAYN